MGSANGVGTLLHAFHTCMPNRRILPPCLCCNAARVVPCLQALQHKQVEGYLQRAFKDRLQACSSDHILPAVSLLSCLLRRVSACQQHCKNSHRLCLLDLMQEYTFTAATVTKLASCKLFCVGLTFATHARLGLHTLTLLQDAKAALETLANSYKPEDIGKHCYHLYEQFRPSIASGQKGWGQKGQLDLVQIRNLAEQH